LRLPPEALAAWRGQLTSRTGGRLTASFVKHTDEQTVAALAGVLQAAEGHGLQLDQMSDWGVFAAPRYLGRVALAQSMLRFAAEGAWGLSPHMIPHRSLHSVSGTISQAFDFHGLNLGIGGGCQAAAEAVLLAAATLSAGRLPGLWVAITGFDPEVIPTEAGREAKPCDCCVVVLALTPARADSTGRRLVVKAAPATERGSNPLSVEALLGALSAESTRAVTTFTLGAGGWIQLDGTRAKTRSVC
jgi:hypothetical protein